MSETKLKPCPFCGGKAYMNSIVRPRENGRSGVYVSCVRKSCRMSGKVYQSRISAAAAWNTRPLEDELLTALRPFAALAEEVNELRHEDDSTCPWRLKAGDIRKALTAITHAEGRQ